MYITNKFFIAALAIACCGAFTACSDDDDDKPVIENPSISGNVSVKPSDVFTSGLPISINGAALTKDSEGRVTGLSDRDSKVTFEYGTQKRSNDFNVLMTVTDLRDPRDVDVFYLRLNARGFVEYALQTERDGDREQDEWRFRYDNDGHLTYVYCSDDRRETNITWTNGNITRVTSSESGDRYPDAADIEYGSQTNLGCVMFYEECFDIEIDELELAYFAGILGEPTQYLPIRKTETDREVTTMDWTLNATGFPERVDIRDGFGPGTTITFGW